MFKFIKPQPLFILRNANHPSSKPSVSFFISSNKPCLSAKPYLSYSPQSFYARLHKRPVINIADMKVSDPDPSPKPTSFNQITSKDIKNVSLDGLLSMIDSLNQSKGTVSQQVPQEDVSNLLNSIEMRFLKEIQVSNHPFTLKDYTIILAFFTRHQSGSVKLYNELESQIPKLIENKETTSSLDTKLLGKLVLASVLTNTFHRPYYQVFNDYIYQLLTQKETKLSHQTLSDLINTLYLLTRKPDCYPESLVILLNKVCSSPDANRISFESILNLTWTVLLKIDFRSKTKDFHLPIEDIEYQTVSKQLEELLAKFRERLVEKGITNLSTLPLASKLRLKQIGLILEGASNILGSHEQVVSVLEALEIPRYDHKAGTSMIHDDVTALLRAMGHKDLQREQRALIYSCDLFLPPKMVLEVNGPSHYIGYDHEYKLEDLDGKTQMRYKTLLLQGYKVRTVSHHEWYAVKGATNRMNLLNMRIYSDFL